MKYNNSQINNTACTKLSIENGHYVVNIPAIHGDSQIGIVITANKSMNTDDVYTCLKYINDSMTQISMGVFEVRNGYDKFNCTIAPIAVLNNMLNSVLN